MIATAIPTSIAGMLRRRMVLTDVRCGLASLVIAGVGSTGALWQYCHSVERADGPAWQWQYCHNAPQDPTPAITIWVTILLVTVRYPRRRTRRSCQYGRLAAPGASARSRRAGRE